MTRDGGSAGDGDRDRNAPREPDADGIDRDRLEAELAAYDGSGAVLRAISRRARDIADAGVHERDRGHPLTVAAVRRNLADAPDGSDAAERWNWWMRALDVAYGGYERFTVRHPDGDGGNG